MLCLAQGCVGLLREQKSGASELNYNRAEFKISCNVLLNAIVLFRAVQAVTQDRNYSHVTASRTSKKPAAAPVELQRYIEGPCPTLEAQFRIPNDTVRQTTELPLGMPTCLL